MAPKAVLMRKSVTLAGRLSGRGRLIACWGQAGPICNALNDVVYSGMGTGSRNRLLPVLNRFQGSVRNHEKDKTHGGSAKGIPRNLSIPSSVVPVTVAESSVTVGPARGAAAVKVEWRTTAKSPMYIICESERTTRNLREPDLHFFVHLFIQPCAWRLPTQIRKHEEWPEKPRNRLEKVCSHRLLNTCHGAGMKLNGVPLFQDSVPSRKRLESVKLGWGGLRIRPVSRKKYPVGLRCQMHDIKLQSSLKSQGMDPGLLQAVK